MKKELFLSIKNEAIADLRVPDSLPEMMEHRKVLPSIIQKWTEYYTQQMAVIKALEVKKVETYAKLEEDWKFNKKVAWSGRELNDQVQGDPKYTSILREIAEQNFYLEYIKGTLDNIKGIVYVIRDYLEYKKMVQL